MTTTARPEQRRRVKRVVGVALQPGIVRSGALTPVLAAGALSVGIVFVTRSVWVSGDAVERSLQVVIMLLAASIGSAIDDPTEPTVASAPIPLHTRRTLRLLPAATVVAFSWAASAAIAGRFAAGSLMLILAGLAVTGTAAAALVAHAAPQRAGVGGAGFVLAAALVITRLPDRWSMLADPTTGLDQPAKLRWAAIIVVGLAILAHASRDPGPRHRRSATHGSARMQPWRVTARRWRTRSAIPTRDGGGNAA